MSTVVSKEKITCQPSYLADRITDYKPLRELRFASKLFLTESVFTTETARRWHTLFCCQALERIKLVYFDFE